MFSLQGNDELLIQNKMSQDVVMDTPTINSQTKKLSKRKIDTSTTNDDHFKLRRMIHRDIERQRRQEMSALYSSLRSLLPLRCIKGKRSVTDHMHEAVNYIKEMQGNIKELEKRRDLLMNSSIGNGKRFRDCRVTVSPCVDGGIHMSISADCELGRNFPLSTLLQELLKQGLNVVTCVSAKVNQRSLYTIQTQACDTNNIDHLALQQKVIDMINLEL